VNRIKSLFRELPSPLARTGAAPDALPTDFWPAIRNMSRRIGWLSLFLLFSTVVFGIDSADSTGTSSRVDSRSCFLYSYDAHSESRYSIGIGGFLSDRVVFDGLMIGLTYIESDPYNRGKCNYSLPPLDLVLPYTIINAIMPDTVSLVRDPNLQPKEFVELWAIPLLMLNSTFYLDTTGRYYDFRPGDRNRVHISPVVSSFTDAFLFRSHCWAQYSAGVGIRLYIGGSLDEKGISIGVERSFRHDFKGHFTHKDSIFCRAGFNMAFE
jgi:hypothetical protein